MSRDIQKLKMLLYINENSTESSYVSVHVLTKLLGVGDREIRRYSDELINAGFNIESKSGPRGGYKITNKLSKSVYSNSNLLLSLLAQSDEGVESIPFLGQLSKEVATIGSTRISVISIFEKLIVINQAINDKKSAESIYFGNSYTFSPYKLLNVGNVYFVFVEHNDNIEIVDVSKLESIQLKEEFIPFAHFKEKINDLISDLQNPRFKSNVKVKLKYKDQSTLDILDREFNGMGIVDYENRIYELTVKSEKDLFNKIFKFEDNSVTIINDIEKLRYALYLDSKITY